MFLFVDYSNKIFYRYRLKYFFQQKLFYFQYIYSSGRKHALRKTAYLPNRTCVAASWTCQIKAYIHHNPFCSRARDQFHAIFNQKNASEKDAKNITSSIVNLKTYEFSRHQCCVALKFGDNANHSYSDRCQPLTDPQARATQLCWRARGCRMPQYSTTLRHANTTCFKSVLFRDLLVAKRRLGSM